MRPLYMVRPCYNQLAIWGGKTSSHFHEEKLETLKISVQTFCNTKLLLWLLHLKHLTINKVEY